MAIAAAIVILVAAVVVGVLQHGRRSPAAVPVSATPDAYAANLPITNVQMSESGNLAGGKVTYIDGHIANKGAKTVTGITVQTLFRNVANEVAQNEVQPMQLVRDPRTLRGRGTGVGGAAQAGGRARLPAGV